jgi:hypothetical protein
MFGPVLIVFLQLIQRNLAAHPTAFLISNISLIDSAYLATFPIRLILLHTSSNIPAWLCVIPNNFPIHTISHASINGWFLYLGRRH